MRQSIPGAGKGLTLPQFILLVGVKAYSRRGDNIAQPTEKKYGRWIQSDRLQLFCHFPENESRHFGEPLFSTSFQVFNRSTDFFALR